MAYREPFQVGDEVTNGTEFGVIELSDFKVRGERRPMVRISDGPRVRMKVWPSESPWRRMRESEAEAAHQAIEDARRSADLAGDTGDNRRTRDGRTTLPRFREGWQAPVRPNATAEEREALDRHRGDFWNPFE